MEWRGCHRSWWPWGDDNGGKPVGIYIRQEVRGGAHFKWYEFPRDLRQLAWEFAHPEQFGLSWIDNDLRRFMMEYFPRDP